MKRNGRIVQAPQEWVDSLKAAVMAEPYDITAPVLKRVRLSYASLPANLQQLVTKRNVRRNDFDVDVVAYPGPRILASMGMAYAAAIYNEGPAMPRHLTGRMPPFRPPGHTVTIARQADNAEVVHTLKHELVHVMQELIKAKTAGKGLSSRPAPKILHYGSDAAKPYEFDPYLVTFDSRLEQNLRQRYRYVLNKAADPDGWDYREALRGRRSWLDEAIADSLRSIPLSPTDHPVEYEGFRRKAAMNSALVFRRMEAEFQPEEFLKSKAHLPKNEKEFRIWLRSKGVANPYKAVIPIVSGIAYVRNGGKTYADLMEELRWLGPGVVARTIQRNTMSNCSEFAGDVAQYLLERGFETAPTGTDGHYSVAVNTADRGWIETDPTAVQFSGIPWNESNALQMGGIDLSRSRAMSTEAKEAVLEKVFEPTIAWSVEGLLTGLSAFKISNWKVPARIRLFSPNTVKGQTMGQKQDPSWRAYWSYFRKLAEDLTKPDMGDWEFIRTWYWAPEVSRRMQGKRISGSVMKSNPADLEGRYIPEKYLAGLPPALQKQRIRELTQSRDAYKHGDYSELPTDRAARKMGLVKESSYTSVAKKRGIEWRGDAGDMAARVLQYYGAKPTQRDVTAFAEALGASFRKGLAAWKSGGHRPGATAQNWAVARVNSLVVGGKTAWTADQKQFAVLPADVRKKIVAKLPELYKALTAQGRGKDVASIKGKAKANPVVKPELRQMIGKELALDLKRPLYSYAKKMMSKYGSRAAGEELVDDAVHGAQDAIIGHFVNRYDDDMIEMYASIGDLYELRPIAIGVGQEAIRNLIRGSMYGAERPDLQFWERIKAQRRALTEPGGPPPSDETVAASLGLTLDELNLKRQERQIFSTTSYDRLLGLGVDPGDRTIEVSEVLTYEAPEGPPPEIEETTRGGREIMSMVSQGLDPEESTYLRQLGVDEIGGRLLADAIVQAALSRLDPNDRILVDTYVEGDTTVGMSDRQFERAIKGGYDPATRTRVPGLVDRVRPILLDTAEKVMALPEEVRDQIAAGKVEVFDAIRKDAARQKQLAARTQRMLGSGPAPAAPKKVPRLRAFRNR